MTTPSTTLLPGFDEPVFDAQTVFRAALNATSYPGRVQVVSIALTTPAPLEPAAAAMALALFDFDTPVWLGGALDTEGVSAYLRFHCGAPITKQADTATFAMSRVEDLPQLDRFQIGEDRYPDRSATLIIAVPSLTDGPTTTWSGPGIKSSVTVAIAGPTQAFWAQWADNGALYPQGVDVLFTCGDRLIGLPRTVSVET